LYICLNCGYIFESPFHWDEKHGFDYPPWESQYSCPKCHGDYAETYKCDLCDEYIVDDYIELDDGRKVCHNCYIERKLENG
jgi:formylmethanofuran dehydrogenase subunit E